jgi:hypothetical protein
MITPWKTVEEILLCYPETIESQRAKEDPVANLLLITRLEILTQLTSHWYSDE